MELYFQHQSSNDKHGQIPLGLIRLGNLAVQGTVKSLPQYHSSKTSILRCSAFFMVQLSHPQEKDMETPAFLPGESHGQRSGAGCSPWGHKESGMTERLHFHWASLTAQFIKNPSAMQETLVGFLGQEDPLDE